MNKQFDNINKIDDMKMVKDIFWCQKCLKEFPDAHGRWSNNYKQLTFCDGCFKWLKGVDSKLIDGWYWYLPDNKEPCDCHCDCCCDCVDAEEEDGKEL